MRVKGEGVAEAAAGAGAGVEGRWGAPARTARPIPPRAAASPRGRHLVRVGVRVGVMVRFGVRMRVRVRVRGGVATSRRTLQPAVFLEAVDLADEMAGGFL